MSDTKESNVNILISEDNYQKAISELSKIEVPIVKYDESQLVMANEVIATIRRRVSVAMYYLRIPNPKENIIVED